METGTRRVSFSIPSIIAIAAAIASFMAGPVGGFTLALVAIAFGVLGVVLSLSPNVRGGFVSMISLMAGGVAILVAVIKALGRLM